MTSERYTEEQKARMIANFAAMLDGHLYDADGHKVIVSCTWYGFDNPDLTIRKPVEQWMNMYERHSSGFHGSRQSADIGDKGRLYVLKITTHPDGTRTVEIEE